VQVPPFGWHIGVVEVEVVLVDVVVVGVVVEVLVVLLVDVVLVVVVVGAAVVVVVVLTHGRRWSPWRRWPSTALLGTSLVCSSGVPGLWQMVTFCC
jgi:small-conductance mechanosensitive channel